MSHGKNIGFMITGASGIVMGLTLSAIGANWMAMLLIVTLSATLSFGVSLTREFYMKSIPPDRLDKLVESNLTFVRSTNPKESLKSFAELIMDEMEKLNKGNLDE